MDEELFLKKFKHTLNWRNGELFVWNIPGIILPIFTCVNLIHNLSQRNRMLVAEIYFDAGEKQSILAADYMKDRFGFASKILFDAVAMQASSLGLGDVKALNLDFEKGTALIKITNSPIAKNYKAIYGQTDWCIDDYMRGLINGVMKQITGMELATLEKSCIAKGDSFCLFETKPLSEAVKEEGFADQILQKENPLLEKHKEKTTYSRI
jgi:hypothetical protein